MLKSEFQYWSKLEDLLYSVDYIAGGKRISAIVVRELFTFIGGGGENLSVFLFIMII